MKKLIQYYIIVAAGLLLLACNPKPLADVAIFEESGPGLEPYTTRMIVTQKYLRIDDGRDDGDFLLYDRKKMLIQNVNNQEKMILVIHAQPVNVESPIKLNNEIRHNKTEVPKLAGREVSHYQFVTNKQVCFDVYTSSVLMGKLRTALAEYRRTLSGEQAMMLTVTPKELLNACDLANNIYSPDRHLVKGFPVRQREFTGRSRQLIDYTEGGTIDLKLFQMPEGYKLLTPQQMRGDMQVG
jgi:hypothetical protein